MRILEKPDEVAMLPHRRIALFSGAFDPIHHGHWDSVAKGLEEADAVILLPCPRHPRKDLEDLAHRSRMIRESFPSEWEGKAFLGTEGIGVSFPETGYGRVHPRLELQMKRRGKSIVILRGQDAFHEPYPPELAVLEHIVVLRKGCRIRPESFIEGPCLVKEGSWGHLSSTDLKSMIRPGVEGLHPRVVDYILSNNLYETMGAAFARKSASRVRTAP